MLAAGLAAASAGLLWILLWSLPPLAAAAIFYAVYLAALIPAGLRYGRRISAAFV
jgi:hypothetical protein